MVDYVENGKINYSEFIAATLKVEKVLNEAWIWTLFKQFDIDNTNTISWTDIYEAFKHFNINASE